MKNMNDEMVMIGGFPSICDVSEKGIDGFVYGFILTGNTAILDTYIKEATSDYIRAFKERYELPGQFALMHFHCASLLKGQKVAVFVYVNKEGIEEVSSWFEVDERDNVVYMARMGFENRRIEKFRTNYYLKDYCSSK